MNTGGSEWEAVHTIHDYWDGPLLGAADFGAAPHVYKRIFDEETDQWANEYLLSASSIRFPPLRGCGFVGDS